LPSLLASAAAAELPTAKADPEELEELPDELLDELPDELLDELLLLAPLLLALSVFTDELPEVPLGASLEPPPQALKPRQTAAAAASSSGRERGGAMRIW